MRAVRRRPVERWPNRSVETGGQHLLRLVRGSTAATPFQLSFARAGHAHAGVLVHIGALSLATGLVALGIGVLP